ncbi:hypothetical protein PATA110616_16150 [Paenibacillus tarimensis]
MSNSSRRMFKVIMTIVGLIVVVHVAGVLLYLFTASSG